MSDLTANDVATGGAIAAVIGAVGALGGWGYKVWRARREDKLTDAEADRKRDQEYIAGLKADNREQESRIKDLIGQLCEAAERCASETKILDTRVTHLRVENEALRGELRMAQFSAGQLRAGVAPMAISDLQVGVIYADQEGTIIEANPMITMLVHYFSRELIGKNLITLMPERYRAAHERGMKAVVQSGRLTHEGQTLPLWALAKDGSETPINIIIAGWKYKERWIFGATIWRRDDDGAPDQFIFTPPKTSAVVTTVAAPAGVKATAPADTPVVPQ